jgi:DNA modification methylase
MGQLIPARLALALQDDGWVLRQEIVWDKGWVRPESTHNRVTRTHDTVYMLCKGKSYFFDQDPIRDPLVSTGGQKPGIVGRDTRTDFRVYNNPLGRNGSSVWRINSTNYRGTHTATFPAELARRMIACSCDDDSVVMDIFGGAGTTALVALQLGHRAITIDINPAYTDEATVRIADAPSKFFETQDDADQDGTVPYDQAEVELAAD